jgi:predicted alpha/beta-hydrolase family hydrolase
MLFLQGDRDEFADLTLLRPVVKRLGERATLHLIQGGDHSFKVLKSTGRTADQVMNELAATAFSWATSLV